MIDATKVLLELPEADDTVEEGAYEEIESGEQSPEILPPEGEMPANQADDVDAIPFPTAEEMAAEKAAMEAELGRNDLNGRGVKMQELTELVAGTPMKSITTPGYKTFAKKELGKPGFPLSDLSEADLDVLIDAITQQNNDNADRNSESQGDLPM
jgi:hypothetical protein